MTDVAWVTVGLVVVNVVLVIVTVYYVKKTDGQIRQSQKSLEVDTTIQLMYHAMEIMARRGVSEEYARAYILGTYNAFKRIDPELAKLVENNWRSWADQQTWLDLQDKAKRIVEDFNKMTDS